MKNQPEQQLNLNPPVLQRLAPITVALPGQRLLHGVHQQELLAGMRGVGVVAGLVDFFLRSFPTNKLVRM